LQLHRAGGGAVDDAPVNHDCAREAAGADEQALDADNKRARRVDECAHQLRLASPSVAFAAVLRLRCLWLALLRRRWDCPAATELVLGAVTLGAGALRLDC